MRSSSVLEFLIFECLFFKISENYTSLIFVGANPWPSIKKTCLCAVEINVQKSQLFSVSKKLYWDKWILSTNICGTHSCVC